MRRKLLEEIKPSVEKILDSEVNECSQRVPDAEKQHRVKEPLINPCSERAHPGQPFPLIPMIDISASTASFRGVSGRERPFSGAAGRFRLSTRQGARRKIEIGQTERRDPTRGVFCDPLVAPFV